MLEKAQNAKELKEMLTAGATSRRLDILIEAVQNISTLKAKNMSFENRIKFLEEDVNKMKKIISNAFRKSNIMTRKLQATVAENENTSQQRTVRQTVSTSSK